MSTQTGEEGVRVAYTVSDPAAGSVRSDAASPKGPVSHRRPNTCSSARLFPFPVHPPLLDATRRRRAPSALRLGAAYEKRIPRTYRKFNLPVHPHYDDMDDDLIGTDCAVLGPRRKASVGKALLSNRDDYESLVRLNAVNHSGAAASPRSTRRSIDTVRFAMDGGERGSISLLDRAPASQGAALSSPDSISPPQTVITLRASSSLRVSADSIALGRETKLIYID